MRQQRPFEITLAVTVVVVAACSGRSSSTPTSPSPSAQPSAATLSAQVVALNGGAPIPGVSIEVSGTSASTDAQGQFSLTLPAGSLTDRVVLTAPQILSRTVFIARGTRSIMLDAIRVDDGAFDSAYYRQLVRNELGTTGLQPIRRWTRSPSFYIRTIDDGGAAVNPSILDGVEADIRLAVPIFSSGRLDVAALERGVETRETTSGWITVKWASEPEPGICGRAHVGLELGGTITLFHTPRSGCACDGSPVSHRLVRHEVGHAMGFWHTGNTDDVMHPVNRNCHAMPTDRERFHVSIAYARPVGNVDPDNDPGTLIRLQPQLVSN